MSGTLKLGATGGQILFSTSGTSGLATPATGYGSLYYGTDSQLRLKDDAGTITILGAGGGTGSGFTTGGGSLTSNLAGSLDGSALVANTTGAFNLAIGASAAAANTIGAGNVAIGYQAFQKNTTGDTCTAVGYQALKENRNEGNTAVGSSALELNTYGRYNTGLGDHALSTSTTVR